MRTLIGLILLASFALSAQPAFDTASVKPSAIGPKMEYAGRTDITPGGVSMIGATLRACVKWAYGVREDQISGPAWLGSERYDIIAKAAGPAPIPELRLMMQALLADRFGLALHRDTKDLPVFEIVVGPGGPKLTASTESGPGKLKVVDGALVFQHYALPELADRLSVAPFGLGRPVVDRTGIAGVYDVTVRIGESIDEMKRSAERAALANEPADPSPYFAAFREAGLKLEAKKEPVEVLVIDRAEKVPKAN